MNISYRWLSELLPDGVEPVGELAERLALLGFPVEGVEDLAEGLRDIVVGKVVEAGPHPDADRLRLCRVDAGTGEMLQVVCGAPNVKPGALYPFIPVGGVLPDGMKIRKAKIRGTHSFGMLCSPRELGLGQDHDGLLVLRGEYAPGTSFVEVMALEDLRLDVEVTSNRGDMLSHVGVARELRLDRSLPDLPGIPGAPEVEGRFVRDAREVVIDGITVTNHEPEACRRFTGAVIRGVTVGPSPDWLQMRLRAVGLRPINNVVDATNYVLMELGQPLHAYDLDRLRGSCLQVRRAGAGETVTTLDGESHELTADMLVIADGENVVDIAGIMGDEATSVTGETTDVFLECAHFEPGGIRTTKKALGIQSDAGYRFERFVDPAGQERALRRCLEVILATAGGTLHPELADVHPRPWEPVVLALRLARLEHVLGVPFTADQVADLLAPLGFSCQAGDDPDTLRVTVPSWRGADVTREVDLVEEVARRHGFHRFPDDLGSFRPGSVPDHPLFQLEDRLRDHLVSEGWYEAQTPAFVPESEGEVRLQNPLSKEEPVLRRELAPSLLRRVEYNLARGNRHVRLFELGTSFSRGGEDGRPGEETRLAGVCTGDRAPRHWSGEAGALDLWDLKGVLEACVLLAWGPAARLVPGGVDGFPGVDGAAWQIVHRDDRILGGGGIVAPSRLDLPPWAGDVLAFEFALPGDPAAQGDVTLRPLPSHPAAERDLALLVPVEAPAGDLLSAARDAAGPHLEAAEIFDLYEGEGLPEGRRSLALRFRFRAAGRTLTDDEVEEATRAITHRLAEEWGVHVRGAD